MCYPAAYIYVVPVTVGRSPVEGWPDLGGTHPERYTRVASRCGEPCDKPNLIAILHPV